MNWNFFFNLKNLQEFERISMKCHFLILNNSEILKECA